MKTSFKKLLSTLMILATLLGCMPVFVFAEDSTPTATAISSMDELVTGQYVLVAQGTGQAVTAIDGTWLKAVEVTEADGVIAEVPAAAVLTITKTDTGYVLTDSAGNDLAPVSSKNSIKISKGYEWEVSYSDGGFTLAGDGKVLAYNYNGGSGGYRGYAPTSNLVKPISLYAVSVEQPPLPPDPPVEEGALVKDLSTLENGDTVVIYNPGHSLAISSDVYPETGDAWYLLGDTVTIVENAETVEAPEKMVWTVAVENGVYTFTQGEKAISAWLDTSGTKTYAELSNLSTLDKGWTLEEANAENHTFYMSSSTLTIGDNKVYVECFYKKQVSGDTFCGYATTPDKLTEADYGMQLYHAVVAEEPPLPPDPPVNNEYATLMADVPADGDKILLHMRSNNLVLGIEATGSKLVGVEQVPEDDKVAIKDGMAVLTAVLQEDGSYALMLGEQYLTTGETGGSLSYGTELSDLSKWVFEVQENGAFTLKNVGALFQENTQYIEYFKGGFTTYKYASNSSQYYEFDLYLVEAAAVVKEGLVKDLSELKDGDTLVIYHEGTKFAMTSETIKDWYMAGDTVTVVDEKVTDAKENMVWTVSISDGVYTFTQGDKAIASYLSGNYVELTSNPNYTGADTGWKFDVCNAENHKFYMYSNTLTTTYGNCYVEVYDKGGDYGNVFTGYSTGTSKLNESAYGLQLYHVADVQPVTPPTPGDTVLKDGDEVVIYNAASESVLGQPNDMGVSLLPAATTIEGDKAVCANGAFVFTVGLEMEGETEVYSFKAGNKYLATNDEEKLFLTETLDGYAKWTLTKRGDGYILYSKAAKYNGNPVCIEFFSGAFSGWTFKASDASIFLFNFYPVAEGTQITEGVVNAPVVTIKADDAHVGMDYTFTVEVDAVFGVEGDLAVTVNGETYTPDENGVYTVPKEKVTGTELVIAVSGTDTKGVSFSGEKSVAVKDEPVITEVSPALGAETGDDKRPVISATVVNAGENPTIVLKVNDVAVDAVYEDGTVTYTPAADMEDGRVNVSLTVTRTDGVSAERTWFFTVGKAQFQLYFGQLHAHTQYSDGAGSLDQALQYIRDLPASANVQFVAFTDHSNYFDKSSEANPEGALYDMSLATAFSQETWASYKNSIAAFNEANAGSMVALGGFEMTWSGGPGHINTFNSPGIVSRNNTKLNNKTDDAGLQAYYALLSQEEGANVLSQFNHPGKTFGNFIDFSYWNAIIDTRIFLVEVGNGEGQIGAGGYYPSYEQYVMALDKGWHVAPTNNQDNHKGRWGNANDARDVILTDNFTEEGIYDAIRARRIYATEDKNLEIGYTVNGLQLGSIISEVPEELNLYVSVYDPDKSDSISKVEVVVNSGKTIYTWDSASELANGELTVTLSPEYSYYFIRVTEGDGDLAVTAPVWVGETLKLGISDFKSETSTPVTDEQLTLTTTLFNSEATAATVKSLTYTTNGDVVLGTDTEEKTIPAAGTLDASFNYTPTDAKVMTITVTAVVEQDGKEYVFTKDLELDVRDADKLVYIGIDASHYNEYVAGNYKDSMGNFGALAAQYDVRTVELKTSEELIAACANEKYVAMIFTAPSRRLYGEGKETAFPKEYSEAEIEAVKAFNDAGGTVIVAGWSDHYENYNVITSNPSIKHMAETQNELLEALGTSLRLGDDATLDNELNGGETQPQRLYFSTYNFDHFLTEGVEVDPENPNNRLYSEVFSQYGGCSVFVDDGTKAPTATVPESVTGVVFGHTTTYIGNQDNDSNTTGILYPFMDGTERVLSLVTDELEGQGTIIVSGAAFMSNFEVQAQDASGSNDADQQKNYSNYRICENLIKHLNPLEITPIDTVRRQTEAGYKYTIEGVVTSNASGYDKDTAFFDCIYVQDETGGICCFPVAGVFKIGDKVRVSGTTDFYQGEPELQVTSIEVIGEGEATPVEVTAKDVNDLTHLGELITVKGTVESFEEVNGLVQTIMVKDANGDICRVFIDGYITINDEVKDLAVGRNITVTGLSSYDDTFNAPEGPFPRIRIRNRADVVVDNSAPTVEMHIWTPEPFHGAFTVNGTSYTDYQGTWYEGTEVAVEAVPDTGYLFDRWFIKKADGSGALVNESQTTLIAGTDSDINVTFGLESARLTIIPPAAGDTSATAPRITLPESAGYSINTEKGGVWWAPTEELTDFPPSDYEVTFEVGKTYYAHVNLRDGADRFAAMAGGSSFNTDLDVIGGAKVAQANYAATSENNEVYMGIRAVIAVTITGDDVFSLNKTETTILVNKTEQLVLTTTYPDVVWESDNTKVATVDDQGTVTALYPGQATITVHTADNTHKVACTVTVLFQDVTNADDYFFTPVYWAVEQGITTGYTAAGGALTGLFGPDDTCTRGQIVTFLWRANGSPEVSASDAPTFKDVKKSAFYYKAVLWAATEGITTGYTDSKGKPTGKFGPDDTCTRGQIVTFLWRSEGSPAADASAAPNFKDVKKSDYFYKAVIWAATNGITTGISKTKFAPNADCTRAMVVTFLYRDMAE